MIEVENMTLPALREHRQYVDGLIAQREVEDRQKAMEAASAAAKAHGFDLSDLFSATRPPSSGAAKAVAKTRKPVEAKYVHPTDASLNWSGRGRTPKWFEEALSNGETRESLEIKRN